LLRHDFNAARVEHSDGRVWAGCRVMIDHTGKAAVWVADTGRPLDVWRGRTTAVESKPPPRTPHAAGPWHLTTVDGATLVISDVGGCGCGSPLRALSEMALAVLDVPA
jgi:hypothetical protein